MKKEKGYFEKRNDVYQDMLSSENEELLMLFKEFLSKTKEKYNKSDAEILHILQNKDDYISVPAIIFASNLAPLESLVIYLKNNGNTLSNISRLLNRNQKTIWTTYNNAKNKDIIPKNDMKTLIPLVKLNDRRLSILESVSIYMRDELNLTFKDISIVLNKSNKTIWTCYNRAKTKLVSSE